MGLSKNFIRSRHLAVQWAGLAPTSGRTCRVHEKSCVAGILVFSKAGLT
jgi:hypothetical protein